jgi:hypothetical protein
MFSPVSWSVSSRLTGNYPPPTVNTLQISRKLANKPTDREELHWLDSEPIHSSLLPFLN